MAKVYTVVNQKGGVSKTTTALNLASGLFMKNKKVLLIDLDPSRNLSSTIGAKDLEPDIFDVCFTGIPVQEAIVRTPFGDAIPGSKRMSTWDMQPNNVAREYLVKERIEPLLDVYDYIIIDTPPMLGGISIASMVASNSVIIPSQADAYSLDGVTQLADTINTVKKYCNPGLTIAGVLITNDNPQTVMSRDYKLNNQKLADKLGTKLFKTAIRHNVSISEAQAMGQPLFTYAPRCNGAIDYTAWISELMRAEKKGGK